MNAPLQERIDSCRGHFFAPKLLDSQLEALEPPDDPEKAHAPSIDDTVKYRCQALRLLDNCGFSFPALTRYRLSMKTTFHSLLALFLLLGLSACGPAGR